MLNITPIHQVIDDSDLLSIYKACANSKYVVNNSAYRTKVNKITFVPDMDDRTINAYANAAGDGYTVTVLGGLVGWEGQFGFIKTLLDVGMPLETVLRLVSWTRIACETKDSLNDITNVMLNELGKKINFAKYQVESPAFRERWRSNVLDIVQACIAHEMGHICLGHCDDAGYDPTIMSSNRNMERQADLFSCSIIQCGTSVATKGFGVLMLLTSFYCWNPTYEGDETHPSSSERVENMITSFKGVVSAKDIALIRKMCATIAATKIPKKKKHKGEV